MRYNWLMNDAEWVKFLKSAAFTMLHFMIIGTIILGGIGILIAVAASQLGDAGPLSWNYVAVIAWNYAKIGLFGGGILGLLYGILSQGSAL